MSQPSNRGLLKTAPHHSTVGSLPYPTLLPTHVIIRTIAVALNPADWQTVEAPAKPGTSGPLLLGIDYAGIIVAVGSQVTKKWVEGDRVAGMVHGGNDDKPWSGAFAEFILVKGDAPFLVPENLSFEEAATLGGGLVTVALGLYQELGLPLPGTQHNLPEDKENTIFIYGGATATGILSIQFARESGYKVLTTCSSANFSLMKSLGASTVLDYHDPTCGTQVRTLTHNALTLIFDTIANTASAAICADAFSTESATTPLIYCNLMGVDCPRPGVKSVFFLGYSATGEGFWFEGDEWEARPQDAIFTSHFLELATELLAEGRVKPCPFEMRQGGLDGLQKGMQDLKEGRVRAKKLVYVVDHGKSKT